MKVLLCGATGYGNMGDDVIRDIYVNYILATFPKAEVIITRPYPQEELVADADAVVIGGGGILYDWEQTNFEYFSTYAKLAQEFGIPYALIGVGFQGEFKDENIDDLKVMLKGAEVISVRQSEDKDYLYRLGFDGILGKDPAYLIRAVPGLRITPWKPNIKVAIIPEPGENLDHWKEIIELNNDAIHFYTVACSAEDIPAVKKIAEFIGDHGSVRDFQYFSPEIITTILGEMDAVYTARFHGIPFGVSGGCPRVIGFHNRVKIKQELPPENYAPIITTKNFWPLYLGCREIPKVNDQTHLKVLHEFIGGILR